MAKKKKQELTSEELLAEALVRKEDWPYRVPGNWVWTRLNYIAHYKKGPFGSAVTKTMFVPKSQNTYKVYEQGVAIRKDINYGTYYISAEKYNELEGFKVDPGDLIVSCAGTVGETFQLPDGIEPGIINQALMRVKVKSEVNLKYFLMYFDEILREDITGKSKGTAIKNIPPFSVLKMMPYPLPPLAEQQRIVDRIESLFGKLDQAKDLIQLALDSFETRKSAILHQAFTGELTKKWREEHGDELESWQKTTIKEIAKFRTGYAFNSKEFSDTGYQVIRMGNLYNGILDLQRNPVFISPELLDSSIVRKYLVKNGDILLTLTGTKYKRDYGYAVLMGENKSLLLNQRIVSLTPERIETNFLFHYLQTELFRNVFFSNETGGVNQGNVSSKFVENIKIPFPTLPEQKEIVRILDDLFEKEQNAKDLCDLIDQIEAMKKAILGKAFRGELGTNETGDESAIELLKVIL